MTLTTSLEKQIPSSLAVKILTWLCPVIFLTVLARPASAQADVYLPFIAIDTANGGFDTRIKNELDHSKIDYEYLDSPITRKQLDGASILLIEGIARTEMTPPKKNEKDHRLYSNAEIAVIQDFVKKGGVLIGSGHSWVWASYGKKDQKDHPLNQIGEALNFSILGQCGFDRYERKYLRIIPEATPPVGAVFSVVKFKGAYDKYMRSNRACIGGGARRGDGHVYIFGHGGFIASHPKFITSVFLGLSPQKRTNTDLVNNNPKESEPVEKQDNSPAPQRLPKESISNIHPLELLAQEGPNLIAWVTSPLDVDFPDGFRANILILREDILDLRANTKKASGIYTAGAELCYNLISSINKKEQKQIEAKLKVAQAKARSPLSNQALEARRNHKMSWPQYEREVRQRDVLSEQKADKVDVRTRELEVKWSVTAGHLRRALDGKYIKFRASIRKK